MPDGIAAGNLFGFYHAKFEQIVPAKVPKGVSGIQHFWKVLFQENEFQETDFRKGFRKSGFNTQFPGIPPDGNNSPNWETRFQQGQHFPEQPPSGVKIWSKMREMFSPVGFPGFFLDWARRIDTPGLAKINRDLAKPPE